MRLVLEREDKEKKYQLSLSQYGMRVKLWGHLSGTAGDTMLGEFKVQERADGACFLTFERPGFPGNSDSWTIFLPNPKVFDK